MKDFITILYQEGSTAWIPIAKLTAPYLGWYTSWNTKFVCVTPKWIPPERRLL